MRFLIPFLNTLGLLGATICGGVGTWAQAPDPSQLTLDRIFASDDFRGERDPMVRWLNATTYVELRLAEKGKSGNDLIRVDAKTGLECRDRSETIKRALHLARQRNQARCASYSLAWKTD